MFLYLVSNLIKKVKFKSYKSKRIKERIKVNLYGEILVIESCGISYVYLIYAKTNKICRDIYERIVKKE